MSVGVDCRALSKIYNNTNVAVVIAVMLLTLFTSIRAMLLDNRSISIQNIYNYSNQSCLTYVYHENHCDDNNSNKNIQIIDPTWSQYIDFVYGDNTSTLLHLYPSLRKNSNSFQFFYLNTNIKILSFTLLQQGRELPVKSTAHIKYPNQIHRPFHSNVWIEVIRYKVHTIYPNFSNEGLFAPTWPQSNYFNTTKVPYGCWFFMAPGSGIYVNVGKVLNLHRLSSITNFFEGYLKSNGCTYDDESEYCHDKYLCLAALAKGAILYYAILYYTMLCCNMLISYHIFHFNSF